MTRHETTSGNESTALSFIKMFPIYRSWDLRDDICLFCLGGRTGRPRTNRLHSNKKNCFCCPNKSNASARIAKKNLTSSFRELLRGPKQGQQEPLRKKEWPRNRKQAKEEHIMKSVRVSTQLIYQSADQHTVQSFQSVKPAMRMTMAYIVACANIKE